MKSSASKRCATESWSEGEDSSQERELEDNRTVTSLTDRICSTDELMVAKPELKPKRPHTNIKSITGFKNIREVPEFSQNSSHL